MQQGGIEACWCEAVFQGPAWRGPLLRGLALLSRSQGSSQRKTQRSQLGLDGGLDEEHPRNLRGRERAHRKRARKKAVGDNPNCPEAE